MPDNQPPIPPGLAYGIHPRPGIPPHDFNRCHCDQWGRCVIHCATCDCVAVGPADGDANA